MRNLRKETKELSRKNLVLEKQNGVLSAELEKVKTENLDLHAAKTRDFCARAQFQKSVSAIKQLLVLWQAFEHTCHDDMNVLEEKVQGVSL